MNIPEEIVVPVVLYFLALVTYTARTVRRIMANHLPHIQSELNKLPCRKETSHGMDSQQIRCPEGEGRLQGQVPEVPDQGRREEGEEESEVEPGAWFYDGGI